MVGAGKLDHERGRKERRGKGVAIGPIGDLVTNLSSTTLLSIEDYSIYSKAKEKNISVSGFPPDPAQKGRPKIFFLIILF